MNIIKKNINERCDMLASKASSMDKQITNEVYPSSEVAVLHEGNVIHNNIRKKIEFISTNKSLREYMLVHDLN